MKEEASWLEYVTAFGVIATPLLVLVLTAIGWRLRTQLERRASLEDKLREDRIPTYNDILEPFILMLMSDAAASRSAKQGQRQECHSHSEDALPRIQAEGI
jgi:hypothetical protein